ncbi:MAG: hypothetical protein QOE98_3051 [Gaiellaceae bacterium]|nr:hypothetical protein [Gaiellaceae bacterium]
MRGLLLAVAIVLCLGAATARAVTMRSLGTKIAAQWTPDRNGTYASRDPRNDDPYFDEYAASMLGATQVMSGRPALVKRGLGSLLAACRHPNYHREFQVLGIASGYLALQRQHLQHRYAAAARKLRACLARYGPTAYGWKERTTYFGNAQVVDYAAYRLIRRAGIAPVRWDRFRHRAERILDTMRRVDGSGGTFIIGVPPRFPLAYHVLTTALLRLAGRPMACAERALAAIQAPNGDAAWSGRSYLQSWTLAAQAYLFTRTHDPMRAARAVTRLQSDTYRIGDRHLRLNPCNCRQDPYAQRPAYEGLTAWFLSLAGNVTVGDPKPAAGGASLDSTLYRVEASADRWVATRLQGVASDWRLTGGRVREEDRAGAIWKVVTPDLGAPVK